MARVRLQCDVSHFLTRLSNARKRSGELTELLSSLRGIHPHRHNTRPMLMHLVRQWFEVSLPYIGTKDFEETEKDFRRGWQGVKFPIGAGAGSISAAVARAKASPLPPEASRFKVPGVRLLVGICRELQRQRGPLPFYLACRDAAAALGLEGKEPHVRAWRWLHMLCHKGILQKLRSGNQPDRKANEYQYLPPID